MYEPCQAKVSRGHLYSLAGREDGLWPHQLRSRRLHEDAVRDRPEANISRKSELFHREVDGLIPWGEYHAVSRW
jgi:hypothetical protein